MQDELEIIRLCKKGDSKSQKILYDQYKNRLMGICLRYAQNREEAEDIFQESFIKVFKSIKGLKDENSLLSWIKKIVVGTAINAYYKNKKHYGHLTYDARDEDNYNYLEIIDSLNNETLLGLINQLPTGYRVVFNLYIIDGYSHKEVAKMLGISVGTSKSQLSKAKRELKKMLAALGITKYEKHA